VLEWKFWPEDIDNCKTPLLKDFLLSHPGLLISVEEMGPSLFSSAKFASIRGKLGFAFICSNSYRLEGPIKSRPRQPDFLKTIHTLELTPCYPGEKGWRLTSELSWILKNAVREDWDEAPGLLFDNLRHLILTHETEDEEWSSPTPDEVMVGIRDFGLLCGTELQSITVSLPLQTYSKDVLADTFSAYPSVEEITIRGGLLNGYRSKEMYASAAKSIAYRCENLQRLHFKNFDQVIIDRPNVSLCIEHGREEILVYIESVY